MTQNTLTLKEATGVAIWLTYTPREDRRKRGRKMNRRYVPPPIYGPGKNNYGRGWGYKGNNKCPKCGKPASPNEVEVCGGMCIICSMTKNLSSKANSDKR